MIHESAVHDFRWQTDMCHTQVREIILSSTAIGARHRDHLVTGNVAGNNVHVQYASKKVSVSNSSYSVLL